MGDWEGKLYTGTADCLRKTFRSDGVRGFYRGISYTLVRAVPVAAVTLPLFDGCLSLLNA